MWKFYSVQKVTVSELHQANMTHLFLQKSIVAPSMASIDEENDGLLTTLKPRSNVYLSILSQRILVGDQ